MTSGNSRALSSSSSNSSRRLKGCGDSDDIISNLPDSILGHILSFSPTKSAVATSILSRRWKFLWKTTLNLYFCYHGDNHNPSNNKSRRFVQFVNRVLLLHKSRCLNKFILKWTSYCDPFYANAWVSAAIDRNVHHLYVRVSNLAVSVQVPSSIFSCQVLKYLYLSCKTSIQISTQIVISLPKLESLTLISVFFLSEEAFCGLLAGCPVLKYLYIDMDMGEMGQHLAMFIDLGDKVIFNFVISSTSLRHLELYVHDEDNILQDSKLCSLELAAPSLAYIKLKDQISTIFVRETLSSLVEANIELIALDSNPENDYCNPVVEAVQAFNCAKTLSLSSHVIWALSSATVNMRTSFNRLSKLEVSIGCCCWSSLTDFLVLSDTLEVLTVKKDQEAFCLSEDRHNNSNWKDPEQVPDCLSNSLKTVSLGAYDGGDDQLGMVGYILKHGNALKLVQIHFCRSITSIKTKFELVQQLTRLPMESTVCKVDFCE